MAKQEYKVMGLSDKYPVIIVEADSYEEAVELAKAKIQVEEVEKPIIEVKKGKK